LGDIVEGITCAEQIYYLILMFLVVLVYNMEILVGNIETVLFLPPLILMDPKIKEFMLYSSGWWFHNPRASFSRK
jgi:hypothetical protein